ncbi:MAG: hypothetical protein WEA54_01355 [Actinomycetota bacterium]
MAPQGGSTPASGAPDRDPDTHAEVVDTLLGLQRRLRGERSEPGAPAASAAPSSRSSEPEPAEDTVVVVDDVDVSVEIDPPPTVGDTGRVGALAERVRKLEGDLSGIFETVGRLADDVDAARSTGASAEELQRLEERLGSMSADLRSAIDRERIALEDTLERHFSRLRSAIDPESRARWPSTGTR